MNTQLSISLSDDLTKFTISSGQSAIATGVSYSLVVHMPEGKYAGWEQQDHNGFSIEIFDSGSNVLAKATNVRYISAYPYPSGVFTANLLLDPTAFDGYFSGKAFGAALRFPIVIKDNSEVYLSSDIVVIRASSGESLPKEATDQIVSGLVNALRFDSVSQINAWLNGTYTRPDGVTPADLSYGQVVHTQCEGSFMVTEPVTWSPSLAKNFCPIPSPFPIHGWIRVTADCDEGGFSIHANDVYDDSESTGYGYNGISKSTAEDVRAYTFDERDTGIVRFSDMEKAFSQFEVSAGDPSALLSRVEALERKVSELQSSQGVTVKAGDGVKVSPDGTISLVHDIASKLATLDSLTDTSTLEDLKAAINALILASKS